MKVQDILKEKGPEVITIGSHKNIYDAISALAKNKIGSLIVIDDNAKIAGIITERDILNEAYRAGSELKGKKVEEVMTKELIICEPGDEVEYVESIMTNNRIRHLPILSEKRLVGIISIGDIVKSQLKKMEVENRYLKDYIEGKYPA